MTSTKRNVSPLEPENERRTSEEPDLARAPEPGPVGGDELVGESFAVPGLSGQTVGHYVVGERLGGGVMTAVYSAYDQIMEREVALKVLLPGADPVTRERFRREARTMSTLEHPNIVRSYQVGQTGPNGVTYIAMELVTGSNLADLLERVGRLGAADACRLLEPIARALEYAHKQGLVHRDVKPSNILLRKVELGTPGSVRTHVLEHPVVPLLSDFGIARALDAPELTSVGRTIGTPAFMSPEQCAGSAEIDGRADIYSLGAVLYRGLVGRAPFVGTTTQILYAHVYEPLIIPDETVRELPALVVEIIRRSMMKERDERYQHAALMAADLETGAGLQPAVTVEHPIVADPTRTMAVLPATRAPAATPGQVLVPAPSASPKNPFQPVARVASVPPRPAPIPKARPRKPRRSNGPFIAAVAMIFVLAILAAVAFTSVAPLLWPPAGPVASPTAVATVQNIAQAGAPTSAPTPMQTEVPAAQPSPESTTAPETVIPTPVVTSTHAPPVAVNIDFAWDNATTFFDERDWQEAYTWLELVRRANQSYQRDRLEKMLVQTNILLATQALMRGDWDVALKHYEEAVELQPENRFIAQIRNAGRLFHEAPAAEKAEAAEALEDAYLAYAGSLAVVNEYCAALDQIEAVMSVLASIDVVSSVDVSSEQARYKPECDKAQAAKDLEETAKALEEMSGRIIYSSQEDGVYRILRMDIGIDAALERLVEDASQPQVSPNGKSLAFFNRQGGPGGVAIYEIGSGNPNDRSVRSEHTEDGRDSPSSWAPGSVRLVFASERSGDGKSHIYVIRADTPQSAVDLGIGKDPAWVHVEGGIIPSSITISVAGFG
jgi:serine/threonine-protein kinase